MLIVGKQENKISSVPMGSWEIIGSRNILLHVVPVFIVGKQEKEEEMLRKFYDYQRKAELYYVYHSIQRYTVSSTTLAFRDRCFRVLGINLLQLSTTSRVVQGVATDCSLSFTTASVWIRLNSCEKVYSDFGVVAFNGYLIILDQLVTNE